MSDIFLQNFREDALLNSRKVLQLEKQLESLENSFRSQEKALCKLYVMIYELDGRRFPCEVEEGYVQKQAIEILENQIKKNMKGKK